MSAVAPQPVSRLTGTTGLSGATTQTDLVVSDRLTKIVIRRVKLLRTAGAGANFVPRIFKVSGAANGSINTVDGTYVGYGQKMAIDRGVVAFGGALDNPRLDILALRPNAVLPF